MRQLIFWLPFLFCLYAAFAPTSHVVPQFTWDKLNHTLAFICLTLTLWIVYSQQLKQRWRVALIMLCFGGFIELVQWQLPYRYGSWLDLLADILGIALGLLAYSFYHWLSGTPNSSITARRHIPYG